MIKILYVFFLILSCNDIKRPPIASLFLSTLFVSGSNSEKIGVISSDFSSSGKFSLINTDTNLSVDTFTNIHSDASGKFLDGKIFILNRLNRDNILVLNPQNAYLPVIEFSVGRGANPYDIVLVNSNKAYISLYNKNYLLVVNPSTGSEIRRIDLTPYVEETSRGAVGIDGIPESAYMYLDDFTLYLQLQRLDKNDPSGIPSPNSESKLLEIDTRSDTITNNYTLKSRNPLGKIQKIDMQGIPHLVFCAPNRLGFISALDGGIVGFNLKTKRFRDAFLLFEGEVGGDILDQQIKSESEGYAYVLDSSFNKTIIQFNPNTGKKIKTLLNFSATAGNINGLALSKSGKLYVGDGSFSKPGVSIFDTNQIDKPKTTSTPIDISLRPSQLFLVE
jgi:outer membrane protein assembly factor BamB